jgi:hypothetical protein
LLHIHISYAFKMVMLTENSKGAGAGAGAGGSGGIRNKSRLNLSKVDAGAGGDDWDDAGSVGGGGGRGGEKRTKRPRSFSSNVQGHYIVNAVTGVEYPWRVGSLCEDLLWKVCDARASRGKYEPDFYFYDSPQQAAEHRRFHRNAFTQDSLDWWKANVARTTRMLKSED